MDNPENTLKIILLIVLIVGLFFVFIYFVMLLKTSTAILTDVRKVSREVSNLPKNAEKIKTAIEDITMSTIDKVVERQILKIKYAVSEGLLASAIKVLRARSQ